MPPRINLDYIAKACGGISPSTVSLALRDSSKIPAPTRSKIKAKAAELGYMPNRNLSRVMSEIRNSKAKHFKETLGFLIPQGLHQKGRLWPKQLLSGAQQRANEIGYSLDAFDLIVTPNSLRQLERTLHSRGIRGIIIAPFDHAPAQLPLDWNQFAAVAIGHSLGTPDLHRVSRDVMHQMSLNYKKLRELNYKKIGFVMETEHEARMGFINIGSFLVEQCQASTNERIEPLLKDSIRSVDITTWFERERPEIIITMHGKLLQCLKQAGYRVPEDVSIFKLNVEQLGSNISGLYPNYEAIGAKAIEQVSALVERSEFGIPKTPSTLLVPGILNEGQTTPFHFDIKSLFN